MGNPNQHQPGESSGAATCSLVFDDKNQTVTLNYEYPYEIDLARVKTERDLLAWSLHLCEKTWMTTLRLHEVITEVARKKGFKVYGL